MAHPIDNINAVSVLQAPATITADAQTTALDQSVLEYNALITVSVAAGGTGTLSIAVTEADTIGGAYTAVPASALFNPDTGEDDTFDDVTTTESNQTLALNLDKCKRFVRAELTAGTSHVVAVVAVATNKDANFSS